MNAHELARDIFNRQGNDTWMTRKQTAWMFSMFKQEVGRDASRIEDRMGGMFSVNGKDYNWNAKVMPNGCALLKVTEYVRAAQNIEEVVLAYREIKQTTTRRAAIAEILIARFPQYSEDQIIDNMI